MWLHALRNLILRSLTHRNLILIINRLIIHDLPIRHHRLPKRLGILPWLSISTAPSSKRLALRAHSRSSLSIRRAT